MTSELDDTPVVIDQPVHFSIDETFQLYEKLGIPPKSLQKCKEKEEEFVEGCSPMFER